MSEAKQISAIRQDEDAIAEALTCDEMRFSCSTLHVRQENFLIAEQVGGIHLDHANPI
ncbi:MAG: hypothetical protein BroJett021_42120 [Chloroflexota bacterium]|nr:MAG: hypothetical protein BroJett021_42120 [Chloroflexota bacterium]